MSFTFYFFILFPFPSHSFILALNFIAPFSFSLLLLYEFVCSLAVGPLQYEAEMAALDIACIIECGRKRHCI